MLLHSRQSHERRIVYFRFDMVVCWPVGKVVDRMDFVVLRPIHMCVASKSDWSAGLVKKCSNNSFVCQFSCELSISSSVSVCVNVWVRLSVFVSTNTNCCSCGCQSTKFIKFSNISMSCRSIGIPIITINIYQCNAFIKIQSNHLHNCFKMPIIAAID